jgi:hypothetical protein
MKYLQLTFLLFLVLSCIQVKAQDNDEILAKAGTSVITLQDYMDRYEFMPHLNYSDDNPDSLKKEFLYSLIAEKLWYLEALEQGLDTLKNIEHSLQTLKKLFLKDELYRKEVESKIHISPEEVLKGMDYLPRVLSINMLASEDSTEMIQIYNSLNNGASFDSLLKKYGLNELKDSHMKLAFGKIHDEELEDIIFSLREGEFSAPVYRFNKWFIYKVISASVNDNYSASADHKRNAAFTLIKERRGKLLAGVFLDKVIGGRSVEADKELFLLFSDRLYSIIKNRKNEDSDPAIEFHVSETDLMQLLKELNEKELFSSFIKFEVDPLTLRDFIFYLIYQRIHFNRESKETSDRY